MSFRFIPRYFDGGVAAGEVGAGAADESRRVWGKKFLRSGRFAFARWLCVKLQTIPRSLMACGASFSGMADARQVFILFFSSRF
jgi:hypothetical protein